MSRRVVITGLGLVSPLGTGVEKSWSGFTEGRSGIRAITRFDPAGFDTRIAGEVPDFKPEDWLDKKEARRLDRFVQYALAACEMAMKESALVISPALADRVACIIGSGIGGIGTLEEQHIRLREKGPSRVSPFFVPMTLINLAAGSASIRFGIRGPNLAPVSACATGAHSVGEAMRMIQRGDCDAALAGGSEAPITPLTIAGFNALKAMCENRNEMPERASRPFERDRSGFVPAEGAAMLVLESLEHAAARGAKVLAELAGYAANSDAHHITAPSPGGEGAARCMRAALEDARLAPSAIGYINAHGTSTPYNDVTETAAIKTVFGEAARRIPVSSNKSMVGHSLGAAGAMELVVSVLALTRGLLPPTINYENPDPECDLDYVPNKARAAIVDAVVSNSFGFGGTNAVLVLRRFA